MRTPLLKKIDSGINNVLFEALDVNDAFFYPLWHYHPEYEIMYLQKGRGNFYVGDCISEISEGQVFFFGPNLPHLFRNRSEYFESVSTKKVKATVLYIKEEFMQNSLFNYNEFYSVKDFLIQSKRGLIIQEPYARQVGLMLRNITKLDGKDFIMRFIEMLSFIADKVEYKPLASIGYNSSVNLSEVDKCNKIFDYLYKNFSKTITLKEIASISNMSSTTFCRYFKKITNKTLIHFTNEIRIGHACKLLIENKNKNISQICYESGFHNLTNFYIQFHKIKNMSPLEFKNSYNF